MLKRPRLIFGAAIPVIMLAIMMAWRLTRSPEPQSFEVPMRDGTRLTTTVYLPRGEGPWPVILHRSPVPLPVDPWPFVRRGYGVASQQTRSNGSDPRPSTDRDDGYDTVEWLAAQPFCARVGVAGHAEVGYLAYLTASARPPHLASAFVSHAPASLFAEGHRVGGIFRAADAVVTLSALGYDAEAVEAYRRMDRWDDEWAASDFATHAGQVDIPIYHATAWYDPGVRGVLEVAARLQKTGLSGARDRQRVLVRPAVRHKSAGDLKFIDAAVDEDMFWWFDQTLKASKSSPPAGVTYYLIGPARPDHRSDVSGYRWTEAWPPAGAAATEWFLQPEGGLALAAPRVESSSTAWSTTPVRSVGGRHIALAAGPADLSVLDADAGVARFLSEPQKTDLVIVGDVSAELYLPEDAGDVVVRLADVYPDGYAAWLAEGAARPRIARGDGDAAVVVDLGPVAALVGAGHRVALYVAGSSRPALAPDPEGPPGLRSYVMHEAARPSAVRLPVLPAAPAKVEP